MIASSISLNRSKRVVVNIYFIHGDLALIVTILLSLSTSAVAKDGVLLSFKVT